MVAKLRILWVSLQIELGSPCFIGCNLREISSVVMSTSVAVPVPF